MSDPQRVLPQVTVENEFYWQAGAEGVLRFQQCNDCKGLIHPPQPICNHCRSRELSIVDVSGVGRLIGFTHNVRFGLPGIVPPYTIAHVAIAEDDRVRVTTRIVDAEVEDLAIGQEMRVVFEHVEDIWFPLFTPTDNTELTDLPLDEVEPEKMHTLVRPPLTASRFEQDSAVTGIGMSRIGRRQMVNPLSLTVDAALAAIHDAGLTVDDIDGLSTYPGGGMAGMGEGGVTALEAALRIRPSWYNGGAETFGPSGSIIAAMMAVSTGLARHVLCFRTVWQSTYEVEVANGRFGGGGGRIGSPMDYILPFGATSAAHTLGMMAQRHMHKYGTTKETLGTIAINQRRNASLNPTAIYRDVITMDDYMNARPITKPFGLLDCDVPCDASVAIIISAVDAARDLKHKPIRFEAVGTQLIERKEWDQSTLTH
ncbi:MAG: zinc ribbon domain-containing protein, partial [Actinomycetota bacterium]|nr:zinc ribbon domain-containing protein [Actinomycetota bacterium]